MRWGLVVLIVCASARADAQVLGDECDCSSVIPLPWNDSQGVLDLLSDRNPESWAGATWAEIDYTVDGMPTTGVAFGGDQGVVPLPFVDQVSVEPGRHTVDVFTAMPHEEINSSAELYGMPWMATIDQDEGDGTGTFRIRDAGARAGMLSAEVDGRIPHHQIWFWAGVSAFDQENDTERKVVRPSDEQLLDDRHIGTHQRELFALGKLIFRPSDRQSGSLELMLRPTEITSANLYGWVDHQRREEHDLTTDAKADWQSKLDDDTTVTAAIGIHHVRYHGGSPGGTRDDLPLEYTGDDDLGSAAQLGGETDAVKAGCADDACPIPSYAVGGPGLLTDDIEQRRWARVGATHTLGHHTLTEELYADAREYDVRRRYSGGYYQDFLGQTSYVEPNRFAERARTASATLGDTWLPTKDLQLDGTLRYQGQRIEDGVISLAMWEPDMGIAYDPSHAGRTSLFARWNRRMEIIPLDLDDRALTPWNVQRSDFPTDATFIPSAVDPDLAPQYTEMFAVGARRLLTDDIMAQAIVQDSRVHDVVEDVTSGLPMGPYYTITNPREATRDHTALTITVQREFREDTGVRVSYTYARTVGTYPGLVSLDNGQVDPNLSSQFDLAELNANRYGPLPQDRPHELQVDGAYAHHRFRVAVSLRAFSGAPVDVLGRHYRYGLEEAFLLPRGAGGRTPPLYDANVRLGWKRGHTEVFVDLRHLGDPQAAITVDESYSTLSASNPIVGGSAEDLVWAKQVGFTSGNPTPDPIHRNPHYLDPVTRQPPFQLRLGARYTF